MNEEEVRMLLDRVIVLCGKITKFYYEPDCSEPDPIKVLERIVDDATNIACDADNLLEGRPMSDD